MHIWHQGLIPDDETSTAYFAARARHATLVADTGTSIDFHGLEVADFPGGLTPAELARQEVGELLMSARVAARVLEATTGDYDAVIVGILQDTGLAAARTLTDLPVVGYGQATALIGRSLGERLGIVAFNPELFPLFRERIEHYAPGFVTGVEQVDLSYGQVLHSFSDESAANAVRQELTEACRRLVSSGCDVLVAGQMLLAEAAWALGVVRVDNAPVLDGLGATIGLAEVLVRLRAVSGLTPGRKGIHSALVSDGVRDLLKRMGPLGQL
ncbi:MAG: aspartate/glutamate racemase family protein [Protaetiibacter sp.]